MADYQQDLATITCNGQPPAYLWHFGEHLFIHVALEVTTREVLPTLQSALVNSSEHWRHNSGPDSSERNFPTSPNDCAEILQEHTKPADEVTLADAKWLGERANVLEAHDKRSQRSDDEDAENRGWPEWGSVVPKPVRPHQTELWTF